MVVVLPKVGKQGVGDRLSEQDATALTGLKTLILHVGIESQGEGGEIPPFGYGGPPLLRRRQRSRGLARVGLADHLVTPSDPPLTPLRRSSTPPLSRMRPSSPAARATPRTPGPQASPWHP